MKSSHLSKTQMAKKPRRLKGFEDFFARDMKIREFVIDTFKHVFEKYGYEPLETPALELTELMLDQSGEEAEKQFYRFTDPGGRDVMLRYEVMIAMCRAVGEHLNILTFPYKRYQIQRCWRAENTQKGRYREFTQCDADTIGSTSMLCDAEYIQMGLEVVETLGFTDYIARISNRKFLEGYAEQIGLAQDCFYGFCMSLDKIKKIGPSAVVDEMVNRRGIPEKSAQQALRDLNPERYEGMDFADIIKEAGVLVGDSVVGQEGLGELAQIEEYLSSVGVDKKRYSFDTSLARGLASYTGPVWEFEVIDGNVGSIAGCGRYDRAIGAYVGKEIPAAGGSFGIERICDILKEREMVAFDESPAHVLVTLFDANTWKNSLQTANVLRGAGISVMLYPDVCPLRKQFKYASSKEIPWVIVIGPEEIKQKVVQVKNMSTGEQKAVSEAGLADMIGTV